MREMRLSLRRIKTVPCVIFSAVLPGIIIRRSDRCTGSRAGAVRSYRLRFFLCPVLLWERWRNEIFTKTSVGKAGSKAHERKTSDRFSPHGTWYGIPQWTTCRALIVSGKQKRKDSPCVWAVFPSGSKSYFKNVLKPILPSPISRVVPFSVMYSIILFKISAGTS